MGNALVLIGVTGNPVAPTSWAGGSTNAGINGADVTWSSTSGSKTSFGPSSVPGGTDFAWIHFKSSLYQSFTVTPGATYTVTYLDAAQAGTSSVATLTAYALNGNVTSVTSGNQLASNVTTPSPSSFNTETFNFTAGTASADTTATLLFQTSVNNNTDDITDVSVVATPEPAAMGLFGVGAVGLLLVRRRKA